MAKNNWICSSKTLLLDESILFNITLDRNVELKNNKHLKKIYEISSLGILYHIQI